MIIDKSKNNTIPELGVDDLGLMHAGEIYGVTDIEVSKNTIIVKYIRGAKPRTLLNEINWNLALIQSLLKME
jgi:hypothetical protein